MLPILGGSFRRISRADDERGTCRGCPAFVSASRSVPRPWSMSSRLARSHSLFRRPGQEQELEQSPDVEIRLCLDGLEQSWQLLVLDGPVSSPLSVHGRLLDAGRVRRSFW